MFVITERQYNIIMKQCQACYPQETGGFLGGQENKILGVLPIPNKNLYDRTEVFALTSDDVDLAYRFLAKHKLEYLGVYHSHPKGVPIPSEQDLAHHQKYLFIVGLQDRYNPALYAWKVEGRNVYQEDIKIVSDAGVTVVDIRTGQPQMSESAPKQEMDHIANMVEDLLTEGKEPQYKKMNPTMWDASTFSTFA